RRPSLGAPVWHWARALPFPIGERASVAALATRNQTRSLHKEAHMTMYRSTLRMFSFAIPLLAAGAPALMAQNRTLFTWTGRVDREVQISMRGRDVWTNSGDGGR